ncbi:MAG: hypothetical protein JWQ02_916 [Capsulimonas sp.]|nr:hypothetical protein [Capsulimonas sp.]
MRFTDLWEAATAEERNTLTPLLVERVNMTEKERGAVRLSFVPADPRLLYSTTSHNAVSNFKMGAALNPGANNFPGIGFECSLQRGPNQRKVRMKSVAPSTGD